MGVLIATLSPNEATLWTAVAAVSGALLSGIITYKVTHRQIRSAETVASEQRKNDRLIATEGRLQAREFDALLVMMRYTIWTAGHAEWIKQRVWIGEHPPEPVLPAMLDDDAEALAQLLLPDDLVSPIELLVSSQTALADARRAFDFASPGDEKNAAWSVVESACDSVISVAQALRKALRANLRHIP